MSSSLKKPAGADILVVIGKIAAGDWLDPDGAPPHWHCRLYDESDAVACSGNAFRAEESMALAWIGVWAPDALINSWVEPGSVPFEIPSDWRFELTPDWVYEPPPPDPDEDLHDIECATYSGRACDCNSPWRRRR